MGVVTDSTIVHGNPIESTEILISVEQLSKEMDHPLYDYTVEQGSFAAVPKECCTFD